MSSEKDEESKNVENAKVNSQSSSTPLSSSSSLSADTPSSPSPANEKKNVDSANLNSSSSSSASASEEEKKENEEKEKEKEKENKTLLPSPSVVAKVDDEDKKKLDELAKKRAQAQLSADEEKEAEKIYNKYTFAAGHNVAGEEVKKLFSDISRSEVNPDKDSKVTSFEVDSKQVVSVEKENDVKIYCGKEGFPEGALIKIKQENGLPDSVYNVGDDGKLKLLSGPAPGEDGAKKVSFIGTDGNEMAIEGHVKPSSVTVLSANVLSSATLKLTETQPNTQAISASPDTNTSLKPTIAQLNTTNPGQSSSSPTPTQPAMQEDQARQTLVAQAGAESGVLSQNMKASAQLSSASTTGPSPTPSHLKGQETEQSNSR